jgi:hypothetical protein
MGNTGKVCMALLRCAVISAAHLPESSEVIAEVNEEKLSGAGNNLFTVSLLTA